MDSSPAGIFFRKARIYVSFSKISSQIALIHISCVANCACKVQYCCISLVTSHDRFCSRLTQIVLNIWSYTFWEHMIYITYSDAQGKDAGNDILCSDGLGGVQNSHIGWLWVVISWRRSWAENHNHGQQTTVITNDGFYFQSLASILNRPRRALAVLDRYSGSRCVIETGGIRGKTRKLVDSVEHTDLCRISQYIMRDRSEGTPKVKKLPKLCYCSWSPFWICGVISS